MRIVLILAVLLIIGCKGKEPIETTILIETVHQKFNSDQSIQPSMTKDYHFLGDQEFTINITKRRDGSYYAKRYLKQDIVTEGASEVIAIQIVNDDKKWQLFPTTQHFESLFVSQGYKVHSKKEIKEGTTEYIFKSN